MAPFVADACEEREAALGAGGILLSNEAKIDIEAQVVLKG
jgi:hypothetical protein